MPDETRKVEADLSLYNPPPHGLGYREGVTGVRLPPDLPFYVRAYRLQKAGDPEQGDKALWLPNGYTVSVDAFAAGVEVLMKYRDGGVTVYTKDADGVEEVGQWLPE